MERNRKRLLVLVLALVTGSMFFLVKEYLPISFLNASPPLLDFSEKDLTDITLIGDAQNQIIYRKNNTWLLKKNNDEYKADEDKVKSLIEVLNNVTKNTVVSTNVNKHRDFEIGNQKIIIRAKNRTNSIFVGKDYDNEKQYLRMNDEKEVFLSDKAGRIDIGKDYRDLKIHLIKDKSAINSIEIISGGTKSLLTKKNTTWFIQDKKASSSPVEYFLNNLNTLEASDILRSTADTENRQPDFSILIKEGKKEIMASFFKKDDKSYILKSSQSSLVFIIPAVYTADLQKKEADFLE